MNRRPRIAVILDENTSEDASRYVATKGYFVAIRDAGGLPFGIPYLPEMVSIVVEEFDGLLCAGGRFAYPDSWYLEGKVSASPKSERFIVEHQMLQGFLTRDKPVLGMCAGMQLLACVNGCRLWADVRSSRPNALEHDSDEYLHQVTLAEDSELYRLVGATTLQVNTHHREAVGELSNSVKVSARADDGIVEAIEIPAQKFAIGLQWHQERLSHSNHPGNAVFRGLVQACCEQ